MGVHLNSHHPSGSGMHATNTGQGPVGTVSPSKDSNSQDSGQLTPDSRHICDQNNHNIGASADNSAGGPVSQFGCQRGAAFSPSRGRQALWHFPRIQEKGPHRSRSGSVHFLGSRNRWVEALLAGEASLSPGPRQSWGELEGLFLLGLCHFPQSAAWQAFFWKQKWGALWGSTHGAQISS